MGSWDLMNLWSCHAPIRIAFGSQCRTALLSCIFIYLKNFFSLYPAQTHSFFLKSIILMLLIFTSLSQRALKFAQHTTNSILKPSDSPCCCRWSVHSCWHSKTWYFLPADRYIQTDAAVRLMKPWSHFYFETNGLISKNSKNKTACHKWWPLLCFHHQYSS